MKDITNIAVHNMFMLNCNLFCMSIE